MSGYRWEFNASTGNDTHNISGNQRIIRMPWGFGAYAYRAEFWGDFSLEYPIGGPVRLTLEQAIADARKLAKDGAK